MSAESSWELYFDGERWSVSDSGARLRLRGEIRELGGGAGAEQTAKSSLYRRSSAGWERVGEDELHALSPRERGWVWGVWPQRLGSEDLVGLRGAIAAGSDAEVASGFLSGLTPLDQETGRPQRGAPGRVFLLSPKDAEVFSERVRTAGGGIERAESWMGETASILSEIQKTSQLIERALQEDLRMLEEAEEGDLSGEIEFDQRGIWIRDQAAAVRGWSEEARERLQISRQNSTQRAEALLAQRELRAASARVEELLAGRERAERILAREIAEGESGKRGRAPAVSEISLKLLLRDLASVWGAEGLKFSEGESELIVELDGEEIAVGRKLRRVEARAAERRRAQAELDPDWPDGEEL